MSKRNKFDEILYTYNKCIAVVNSTKTEEQLDSAIKYSELFYKNLDAIDLDDEYKQLRAEIRNSINKLINLQRKLL